MFVGRFEGGIPSGLSWRLDPDFGTALYGLVDDSGTFTGDDIALVMYDKVEPLGIKGKFDGGIMREVKKVAVKPERDSSRSFLLRLSFEVGKDLKRTFVPAPNLRNSEEAISAQFTWFWNYIQDLQTGRDVFVDKSGYSGTTDIVWYPYNDDDVKKCKWKEFELYGKPGMCAMSHW